MTSKEAVRFLARYQSWRRGDIEVWSPTSNAGPDPREVSEAISMAIAVLDVLAAKEESEAYYANGHKKGCGLYYFTYEVGSGQEIPTCTCKED